MRPFAYINDDKKIAPGRFRSALIIMKTIKLILDRLSKYGWAATLVFLASVALAFTWSSSDEIFTNIRLFDRIALLVDQNYVEDVDRAKLVKAGIDGMLGKLDKYTKYLEGGDFLHLQQATDGKIEGIGVYLEYHHDSLTVTSILEGTPGEKAGLRAGDIITQIDSVTTFGLELKEVRVLLSGEIGSAVDLAIHRHGSPDFMVKTHREQVDIESVPYYGMVEDRIGYVKLARFSEKCAQKLNDAIVDLKHQGMHSLILDLRKNPGGLLAEAIEAASLFLPENSLIVETRARDGSMTAAFAANGKPVFPDGDLAVVIDEGTASAAEILAGAIQDHDRGVLIGTSSYGKGLVQQVLMVGDESALKITTSRYHLPSGRCLQTPDWSTFELAPDGAKTGVNDSLYFTSGGRPVFGAGGITPDIYIDPVPESDYIDALRRESLFFDFATTFAEAATIEPDFEVDDKLMERFRTFVGEREFKFEDAKRAAFEDLKKSMEKPDTETQTAFSLIDGKLSTGERWLFDSNYSLIREELEDEIIKIALGEDHLYEKWLHEQPEINASVEILRNDTKYSAVFSQR